jgi:hypothetical protein
MESNAISQDVAIHPGQNDVSYQEINRSRVRVADLQSLVRVPSHEDLIPCRFQASSKDIPYCCIVVDDQERGHSARGSRLAGSKRRAIHSFRASNSDAIRSSW